jgi:hypothetical protein
VTWILLIVLSAHGLLSILKQFRRFQPFLNRLDPVGVLPYWSFFAPKPGTSDYRVLVRKKDADGNVGSWSEICVLQPRLASHLFWNPGKLRQKCVYDCVRFLLRLLSSSEDNESKRNLAQVSWPYIKLAQLAFSGHSLEKDELLQFSIVDSQGLDRRDVRCLFLSEWHR